MPPQCWWDLITRIVISIPELEAQVLNLGLMCRFASAAKAEPGDWYGTNLSAGRTEFKWCAHTIVGSGAVTRIYRFQPLKFTATLILIIVPGIRTTAVWKDARF